MQFCFYLFIPRDMELFKKLFIDVMLLSQNGKSGKKKKLV